MALPHTVLRRLESPDCSTVCKQSRGATSSAMSQHEGDDHAAEEEQHVGEDDEGERHASAISTESLLAASDHVEEAHGGTQSSHRLLAYSDALLSIIATVMILPVAHTKMQVDEELDENLQLLLGTKLAVYLMTFLIVTVAWAAHIRLFQVIVRIDDTLALLNLVCRLMWTLCLKFLLQARDDIAVPSVSFLFGVSGVHDADHPAAVHSQSHCRHRLRNDIANDITAEFFSCLQFSLMATFPSHILGILLFCGCVMVIGLIQSVIVLYAFSRPFLLQDQIQACEDRTVCRHHILKVLLRVPVMCLLAAVCSFFCYQLSYVLLALVIFLPYISQGVLWCRDKLLGPAEEDPEQVMFYTFLPSEPLSKERVEAFSDGVYAIVATLLILDICEDNVPDPATVRQRFNGSLVAALRPYGSDYLAYLGSFATVGLLWFVHHSLFLHVAQATRLMGLLNTMSLAFVGGLPLAFQLTHELPHAALRDERRAVQAACVLVFGAGAFQLATWVAALQGGGQQTLRPAVRYGGPEHVFMLAKLTLYPAVALAAFLLTIALSRFSATIFHLMEIATPFAFLLLRLTVRVVLALLRRLFGPQRRQTQNSEENICSGVPFNPLLIG
ncbi:endosomal/lysosomal proton channel TMEM175 isoform X2 [Syngnathus scovelli]|uniref:endosomal/lysosomal proton channel TMEM175 isoform X2 n=1 Tax=Syngnathus scovelli TaxID=161590 RepID=UPI002110A356|nr:endosomal/lysosomal proton channel TMEM175 isoform X2 [Syngnathus scovelli]